MRDRFSRRVLRELSWQSCGLQYGKVRRPCRRDCSAGKSPAEFRKSDERQKVDVVVDNKSDRKEGAYSNDAENPNRF